VVLLEQRAQVEPGLRGGTFASERSGEEEFVARGTAENASSYAVICIKSFEFGAQAGKLPEPFASSGVERLLVSSFQSGSSAQSL
jgi:hypothetical protein